jgi:hypothetical protein
VFAGTDEDRRGIKLYRKEITEECYDLKVSQILFGRLNKIRLVELDVTASPNKMTNTYKILFGKFHGIRSALGHKFK